MVERLRTITARYRRDLLGVYHGSCLEVARRVITRTPVDKGPLRSSWVASNGEPDYSGEGYEADVGVITNERIQHIREVVSTLDIGDTFSMGTGKPYARRIEHDGWSAQAPAGMLRRSVAEWPSIVKGVARAL